MLPDASPRLALTPLGRVTCASLPFRAAGQLRVAVVVKATFVFVPDGPMRVADPAPILAADESHGPAPASSLRASTELVPYRPRADVLLFGGAGAQGRPTPSMPVRLTVTRGEAVLIDKQLTVQGWPPRGDGAPAPAPDPDAPIPDFPADFAWGHFNVAPEDQRIDFVRGDEWIALDGMCADVVRVRSCLPGAQAMARLYGLAPGLRAGRSFALVADTLSIDADRLRCSVVWRGSFAVSSEAHLAALHVAAGLETAEELLAFPASYDALLAKHVEAPPARELSGDVTVPFAPSPLAQPAARSGPVLPFVRRAAPSAKPGDTQDIVETIPPKSVAAPVIPFVPIPLPPREPPRRLLPAATPFEGAALSRPIPPDSAQPVTLRLDGARRPPDSSSPASARGAPSNPNPPEPSRTLGEHFLAAMARAAARTRGAHAA